MVKEYTDFLEYIMNNTNSRNTLFPPPAAQNPKLKAKKFGVSNTKNKNEPFTIREKLLMNFFTSRGLLEDVFPNFPEL
jgi:hypothetical protein